MKDVPHAERIDLRQRVTAAGSSTASDGHRPDDFTDHRRTATAQRRIAGLVEDSDRTAALRTFGDSVEQSPRMLAQRAAMAPIRGANIQMQVLGKAVPASATAPGPSGPVSGNGTGLPDRLKAGIENLSGIAMDGVRVHYNSSRPAQLHALAYAQGDDIHIGPGQEEHLPHEAWHVVQQKQGRVRATRQMKQGIGVNDDAGLEREADVMGDKAASFGAAFAMPARVAVAQAVGATGPVQCMVNPEALEFMIDEELLEYLKTLSLTELHETSSALAELHQNADPKPRFAVNVEKYVNKQFLLMQEEIENFCIMNGYAAGKTYSASELFENLQVTLYPKQGENPLKDEKAAHRPHRPILDIEFVGRKAYARCYLGLYSQAGDSKFKDVTSSDSGEITLKDIGLMNLGNPFKALLWCEDYLTNQEHYQNADREKPAPKPVVRSFLVPLDDASGLLRGEGAFSDTRPLDQDRGSGQFGNRGDHDIYAKVLHPLIGSLVSFFHDPGDYAKASDKGQKKFGLIDLQEFLTGQREDPRAITKGGIAAQHGRGAYKAPFDAKYADVMAAYYESVDPAATDFTGATGGEPAKFRKSHAIPKEFDAFPLVKKLAERLSPKDLAEGKRSVPESIRNSGSEALSPSLTRLQNFVAAYNGLPVRADADPAERGLEGADKGDASDRAPGKEEPKRMEGSPPEVSPVMSGKTDAPKVEKENPQHQYASAGDQAGPIVPARWFQLVRNPGGGDCLFHALEGRTLKGPELLLVRQQVADVRGSMHDTATGSHYNANVVAATILQTPRLERFAPMIAGRDSVPNSVLAQMQSIPGVYAGSEELIQWCALRGQTVFVVDADGSVVEYSATRTRRVTRYAAGSARSGSGLEIIRSIIKSGKMVLYKSPSHWERIEGIADQFGK